MRESYKIRRFGEVTFIKVLEHPTYQMFTEIIDKVAVDNWYVKRIWDIRDVGFDFSEEEIRDIATYGQKKFPEKNYMAVVVKDPLGFGLTRQFSVYREDDNKTEVKIFSSPDEASEWLRNCD